MSLAADGPGSSTTCNSLFQHAIKLLEYLTHWMSYGAYSRSEVSPNVPILYCGRKMKEDRAVSCSITWTWRTIKYMERNPKTFGTIYTSRPQNASQTSSTDSANCKVCWCLISNASGDIPKCWTQGCTLLREMRRTEWHCRLESASSLNLGEKCLHIHFWYSVYHWQGSM